MQNTWKLTEDLQPDVRGGPLVADAVVRLADVGARLVTVHGLDHQRLRTPRLLTARQQVVLQAKGTVSTILLHTVQSDPGGCTPGLG